MEIFYGEVYGPLQIYIDSILIAKDISPEKPFTRIVSDGTTQLSIALDNATRKIVNRSSEIYLRDAWVVGCQSGPTTFHSENNTSGVNIQFKPGGLYSLCNIPQTSLSNQYIPADIIFGNKMNRLIENIRNCIQIPDIITLVNEFFLAQLDHVKVEPYTTDFFSEFRNMSLETAIAKSGYSQKHFISFFKKHIGISPKKYQRILRFNSVLTSINRVEQTDWPKTLYDHNLFDQSHLIKEFHHFTGISPTLHQQFKTEHPLYLLMGSIR